MLLLLVWLEYVELDIGDNQLFTPPRTEWAVADIFLATAGLPLEGLPRLFSDCAC